MPPSTAVPRLLKRLLVALGVLAGGLVIPVWIAVAALGGSGDSDPPPATTATAATNPARSRGAGVSGASTALSSLT